MLQKTLEQRSDQLFKKANPFDLKTIQNWVETLSMQPQEIYSQEGGSAKSISTGGSSQGSARCVTMVSYSHRERHPWELDAKDLLLGDCIGTGSQGQVFKGSYKGSNVAVKTLFQLTDASSFQTDPTFISTAKEAELLSKLHHVNAMRFFGICFLAKQKCIAMVAELCSTDLRTWIDERSDRLGQLCGFLRCSR